MSVELGLLVNPTAGRGRAGRLIESVCERLRAGGVGVDLLLGPDATRAGALAAAAVAAGVDGLVALGGDGIVNLAAQAVAGSATPLGIVPAGTGNDCARAVGVPLDPRAAVDVVLGRHTRVVDVGRVGDRVFLTVVGSGFDSRVTERANRMTWPRGRAVFPAAMLAELRVFRPMPFEIVLDGVPRVTEAMLVAVGNGPSYGGGMRVCPAADLTDGLLDVTVLGPMSTGHLLRMFPSVYRGEHLRSPAVLTARAASVSLSGPGLTAYADGEPVGTLPVTVQAVPAGLTVYAPAPLVAAPR